MSKNLSLYISHPLSGLTVEEVDEWYERWINRFKDKGFRVFDPISMQSALKNMKNTTLGHTVPDGLGGITNDKAIFERDKWAVTQADIILVDLSTATKVSIGCLSELIIAHTLNKHTITIMDKHNCHWHSFIIQASAIILDTMDEASHYLEALNK